MLRLKYLTCRTGDNQVTTTEVGSLEIAARPATALGTATQTYSHTDWNNHWLLQHPFPRKSTNEEAMGDLGGLLFYS